MKKGVAFCAAILLAQTGLAQGLSPDITYVGPDGTLMEGIRCTTTDFLELQLPRGPEDLSQWILQHGATEGTIYIPVAMHVITAANGVTGNVTDERINRQIDTLNTSFASAGISFYLASVDRTANDNWFYSPDVNESVMKASLAIDPTHNLNIYTAQPSGGILGWAWLPWSFPENSTMHGTVILHSTLPGGSAFPYNLGATATHEVGHYLGLYHTFENGCNAPGDLVEDTPFEASPAFGCPAGRNTCPDPEPDPIHNYMDYTDDACMWEFTQGQADRMDWAINTYKPGLLSAAAVPLPPADVTAYSDYTMPTVIELEWTDPANLVTGDTLLAADFHIQISRDGAFLDSVAGGVQFLLDTGLEDGETYTYELFARIHESGFSSDVIVVTGTAGGSRIPGTPEDFTLSGSPDEIMLYWTNPSGNIDGSPMSDFAGIRLYQDDALVTTFVRSATDTSTSDSASFMPAVPGLYGWRLTSIDSEIPQNESPPTETLLTPLGLPAIDPFSDEGLPGFMWSTVNGEVNTRADDPPSPLYALNLNGQPIGGDTVEMRPIDLTGLDGSGIVFGYYYQPQGQGNAPEVGDSLLVDFKNDLGSWIRVSAYPGTSLQPFTQELIEVSSVPAGGGTFFHGQFQIRFSSKGSAGTTPSDDWFVDNVFLGTSSSSIASSMEEVIFDTTIVGMSSSVPVEISNVGIEDLVVTEVVSSSPDVFTADSSAFAIAPGEHLTLTLVFAPDAPGFFEGTMGIVSNDPNRDTLFIPLSGVGDVPVNSIENRILPREFSVSPNYPNPFNPATTIKYEVPKASSVEIVVYNILGSRVKTLVHGIHQAGYYEVEWNGTNDAGIPVTSGIYVYSFSGDRYQSVQKMILIK